MQFPSKGHGQRYPYHLPNYQTYYQANPYYIHNIRQYPEVNTQTFVNSAETTKTLIQESELFCNQITSSEAFAKELMEAAQASNDRKVKELIKSTGVNSKIDTSYNPDGINITFSRSLNNIECCKIKLALRWR